jgi:hypothetical protein
VDSIATVVTPQSFSHAAILQPRRDRLQIAGVRAELAHPRRQLVIRIEEARRHVLDRHRHEMLAAMHIDPRRIPMPDRQILGLRRPAKLFACARCHRLPSFTGFKNIHLKQLPRARECRIGKVPKRGSPRTRTVRGSPPTRLSQPPGATFTYG